jgi:sugar phosphate isomerase/epimerase
MQSNFTRRKFARLAVGSGAGLAGAAVLTAHDSMTSKFSGVTVGAQSYSFRDRPLDEAIAAMKQIRIGSCELWSGHTEPLRELRRDRAKLRAFRLETPLSHYEEIGESFHAAGIELNSFNYSFRDDFTDEEIARGFEMAKAMGAGALTASATVSVAGRVNAHAQRYGMKVGMHNHSRIRENEYATPADFAAASKGNSHIGVNLDIGHFVAAGFDPVDYIKRHHAQIVALHIKDRKRDQGENTPFGEGDTPIRETLALLRDNSYDIPANIEYEYKGGDTVEEVKKCFDYCKRALAS